MSEINWFVIVLIEVGSPSVFPFEELKDATAFADGFCEYGPLGSAKVFLCSASEWPHAKIPDRNRSIIESVNLSARTRQLVLDALGHAGCGHCPVELSHSIGDIRYMLGLLEKHRDLRVLQGLGYHLCVNTAIKELSAIDRSMSVLVESE